MLEKSFDNIFIQPKPKDQNLDFWREKIKKSVRQSSGHDKGRNRSCDYVYNSNQLNVMFQFLRSEQQKLKKELKNQENLLKSYKTHDFDEATSNKSTEYSTPLSKKSLKQEDLHLFTFKPGDRWTDSAKPARKHFPRDVFTVPKINLTNIY